VSDVLDELRSACALVAERARHVHIERAHIPAYVASLPVELTATEPDPAAHTAEGAREHQAAFWLTLDAINFGSGWFPTLRKRAGRSGYFTIATALTERFATRGPWPAHALAEIDADELAGALGQDPAHELMGLFAASLKDLGRQVATEHDGRFAAVLDAAGSSAVALVERLKPWDSFADSSRYDGIAVPFLRRASSPRPTWPGPAWPPSATSIA